MEGDLLVAIATVVAVIITGLVTLWQVRKQHRDSIRQMREETSVLKYRKRNDQRLEALQHCWELLIYTTDNENKKSIITFKVERMAGEEKKTYYFHKSNINAFIDDLRHFFYTEGWGLYLSKELKELLFGYERIVWGLKLSGEKSPEEVQQIRNDKVAEKLFEMHQQLIIVIKQDMNRIYNDDL
jgi:hypothetical protein